MSFDVEEISAQDIKDVSVSSTKIRHAIINGDLHTAQSYLGAPYFLTGKVIKGKGLGKKLQFPTANINVEEDYKLIPKRGAYVISAIIDHKETYGMLNIGMNPTVNGTKISIEAHFFDTDKNLYDKTLKIEILHRLRDEKKFDSLALLQEQLKKDKLTSLEFIKTYE